jgi:anti-anti-sigma regulatory factor
MSPDDRNRPKQPPRKVEWQILAFEEFGREHRALLTFREADLRQPHKIDLLRSEFDLALERARGSLIVIDFGVVEHVSSAVLGLVLHLAQQARERSIAVVACEMSPEMERALRTLSPGGEVEVCPSRRDAVEAAAPRKRWWWPFG